jgi:hypothetical protein
MSPISKPGRRLPIENEIFLDHVGHFVPDRERAARALRRVGFAPTPVSVGTNPDGSPTGTGNITAMLDRGYLEILFKTADTPLGRELSSALARYTGVHLAAFAVADAARAHRRLAGAGFAVRPLVEFARHVDTPAGPATAAFTVARVEPGAMTEGRIQILTHLTEQTVWQERWLVHPNGARGLSNIVFAVADVEEAATRFARFTNRPATRSARGQLIRLDRGCIEIVSAQAFVSLFPEIAIPTLPFAGAYVIEVKSIETVERIFRQQEPAHRRIDGAIVAPFPRELGIGFWVFTEAPDFPLFGGV